jgi:hypothetical protein
MLLCGFICLRIAMAPATWGVAMEVPLLASYPPPGTDEFMPFASPSPPGARTLSMRPEFEKSETSSASVVEPTAIAVDMHAGAATAFLYPSLPEATTVAMPSEYRFSMAALSAGNSESQASVYSPPPRLMFTAAMSWAFLTA